MADLSSAKGRHEEALAYRRRSLATDQARVSQAATNVRAREDLAEHLGAFSEVLRGLGRLEEALEASRKSIALFEEFRASSPNQARVEQLLAEQYRAHGALVERLISRAAGGEPDVRRLRREGCSAFQRSLDLWKHLEKSGAALDADNRSRRADMEQAIARCDADLARPRPDDR